jgi:PST family polysaccharide transporter
VTGARRGLTKRSIAGVLWTGLSVGAEDLLQIVALMVLARLLAPADFGLFAATMIVIGLATIFGGLGVAPAIVQRPVLEPRHVRTGFTLSILLCLTMAGLVWAGAPLIAHMFRLPELAPVVRATAVVFLLQGFSSVAHALAQRALRFGWLAGVHAAALTAGYVVVGPLLAWQGFGVWALIGALLVQNLTRMTLLQIGQPHPMRPQLDRRAVAELLYFGGGFTLARIGNYLASQADKLVVGRWLGAQTLGVYVLTVQLVAAPAVLVGQVLDRVLFPTMALVQREPSRLARAYRSAVSICAVVALPTSVLVALLAAEIIEVLLGGQWSNAVAPLQILAFGILFRTSYKLGDSVARATGAVYARAWRQALFAVTVAVMAFVGQRWGICGVAVGAVVALALNFLLMSQLGLRLVGLEWRTFCAAHVPGLLLAAAVGALTGPLVLLLREMQLAPALVLFASATTATATVALLWRQLPSVFLGSDAQALLRAIAEMTPAPYQRPLLWLVAKEIRHGREDDLRGSDPTNGRATFDRSAANDIAGQTGTREQPV